MDDDHTYILRTCNADMTAHGGFRWPTSGPVEAPDWDPAPECGGGLHGLLCGEGNGVMLDNKDDAKWLVVKVPVSEIVDLGGKVKFSRGVVIYAGDRDTAVAMIQKLCPRARAVAYSTNAGCDGSTSTGGDFSANTGDYLSTNTGGNYSTNTGGRLSANTGGDFSANTGDYWSTNTGGYDSTNTGGDRSTNTGGRLSTNNGGDSSSNTGGDWSRNTGGDNSTNTGGNCSTNIGGDCSRNAGGNYSHNAGGVGSRARGGDGSVLSIQYIDSSNRRRMAVAYVGENGIVPDTWYGVDRNGEFVEVWE